MEVTFSIDDDVLQRSHRKAEVLGTSVNEMIRDYLEQVSGNVAADAAEFERLSNLARGNSQGWKFNREQLHERV